MRVLVRSQEITCGDLAKAIQEGIRAAAIESGRARSARRMRIFQETDKAVDGAICKNIDELIKAEAVIVAEDLRMGVPPDIKAIRTEVSRLGAYIEYKDLCKRGEST